MAKEYKKGFRNPLQAYKDGPEADPPDILLMLQKNPLLIIRNMQQQLAEKLKGCRPEDRPALNECLADVEKAAAAHLTGDSNALAWALFKVGYFVGVNDFAELTYTGVRGIKRSKTRGNSAAKTKAEAAKHKQDAAVAAYDSVVGGTEPRDRVSKVAARTGYPRSSVRRYLEKSGRLPQK